MNARSYLLVLPLLLAFSPTANAAGTNIVANGDFEIHPPSAFPPWQFSAGYDAFINASPPIVASGKNCVFIGGPAGGLLWQDINTQVGQLYQFSFYERGDDPVQTERISLLKVSFGDQLVGSFEDDNRITGWNYHVYDVVADSTTTALDFQQASSTIGSYGYPGVDDVSVVAVPEPSMTGLVGTALVMVLGIVSVVRSQNSIEII